MSIDHVRAPRPIGMSPVTTEIRCVCGAGGFKTHHEFLEHRGDAYRDLVVLADEMAGSNGPTDPDFWTARDAYLALRTTKEGEHGT